MLWCVFGWCLHPKESREVTLLFLKDFSPRLERKVRYFRWLQSTGILTGTLVLVDCGMMEIPRKQVEILAKDNYFVHLVSFGDLQTYFTFTRSEHGTGI